MSAQATKLPHPKDAPGRLYSYEELSEVTGLSKRRIRRMVEEGRISYVQTGEERGRMIEGQQYLAWVAAGRREQGA